MGPAFINTFFNNSSTVSVRRQSRPQSPQRRAPETANFGLQTSPDKEPAGMSVISRLPQITALFWAMKIAATTFGETGGDSLSMSLDLGYAEATLLFFSILAVCLFFQLRARRFQPALFWAAIAATVLMGTTLADFIDRGPGDDVGTSGGLGYVGGMAVAFSGLILVFVIWRASGRSFDIQKIVTRRAEVLFWIAILLSNTMGTALGDYLADELGLGFWRSGVLIAILMVLVMIVHYTTRVSPVLLFWIGFVLTRPLGTVLGNYLSKSHFKGGLELGNYGTTFVIGVVLVIGIGYSYFRIHQAKSSTPMELEPEPGAAAA